MRIQIRNRGTAALSALTLIAATGVALVGLQSSAIASSGTVSYNCDIQNPFIGPPTYPPTPYADVVGSVTVSPTSVDTGTPQTVEIQLGTSDGGVSGDGPSAFSNGPVAPSTLGGYQVIFNVTVNGGPLINVISETPNVAAGTLQPAFPNGIVGEWTSTFPEGANSVQLEQFIVNSTASGGAFGATGTETNMAVVTGFDSVCNGGADKNAITGNTGSPAVASAVPASFLNAFAEEFDATTSGAASLELVKSTDAVNFTAAGNVIDYTFAVENTGDVDVTGLVINDELLDAPAVCDATSLVAAASTTCTGSYTAVAGDVSAGSIVNVATAEADAEGESVESPESEVTVELATNELTLVKKADAETFTAADETINYTLTLSNTGNTTVAGPFSIDDPLTTDEACPDVPASLAPGEDIVCTASYTTTAQDVTNAEVVNTATGAAVNDDNPVESDEVSATVALAEPGVELTKNANVATFSAAGQTIDYTLTLTNTGNVELEAPFAIDDPLTDDEACPVTPTTVAVGASIECSASYTTTAEDVTAGEVTNVATGSAFFAGEQGFSNESSVTVTYDEAAPTQDIPSRVTKQISGINCQNTLLSPGPWTGAGQGGGTAPAATEDPTFTLDLSPAVPEPGAPVAITVVFSEGIANGPTTINGSIRPAALIRLSGAVTDEVVVTGTPYQGITPADRFPGQTMVLENAFTFPEDESTVVAELVSFAFDANSGSTIGGGTASEFNWPNPPESDWSFFTTVCSLNATPLDATTSIGLQAAVPFAGELPPIPPVVDPPPGGDGDDGGDTAGGTLPQTGGTGTVPALLTALVLFQLGLILAVRSVRMRPRHGAHAA